MKRIDILLMATLAAATNLPSIASSGRSILESVIANYEATASSEVAAYASGVVPHKTVHAVHPGATTYVANLENGAQETMNHFPTKIGNVVYVTGDPCPCDCACAGAKSHHHGHGLWDPSHPWNFHKPIAWLILFGILAGAGLLGLLLLGAGRRRNRVQNARAAAKKEAVQAVATPVTEVNNAGAGTLRRMAEEGRAPVTAVTEVAAAGAGEAARPVEAAAGEAGRAGQVVVTEAPHAAAEAGKAGQVVVTQAAKPAEAAAGEAGRAGQVVVTEATGSEPANLGSIRGRPVAKK